MKKTLLFIAALTFVGMSLAQIETRNGLTLINSGDTVAFYVNSPDFAQFGLSFTNTSTTDAKRLVVSVDESRCTMAAGMTLAGMCADGECLSGTSCPPFIVGKDSTYTDFHLNINVASDLAAGTFSLVKMDVTDPDNTADTVNSFYVKVVINAASINEAVASDFDIYPNPASDMVRISMGNMNVTKIQVVNMLGAVVREAMVEGNNGEQMISVAGMKSGIYACNLISESKILASKKLVVK